VHGVAGTAGDAGDPDDAAAAAAAALRREFARAEAKLAEARAEAMLRAVMAGAEMGSYEPAVRSLSARRGEIGEIDWSLGGAGRREETRPSAVVSTPPSRSPLLQGGNFVWANKRLMVLD
jgi:hypothetical protein